VAEVAMTGARARLTELLRRVRYGGNVAAFTERGERSAYVVTPDFYARAFGDRANLLVVTRLIDSNIPAEVRDEPWARELLEYAARISPET
jgi:prevent-host-death family protein